FEQLGREAADKGKNSPRERWERAIFFASQLRDGNAMLKGNNEMSEQESSEVQKHLETQHWLELVDGKHRKYDLHSTRCGNTDALYLSGITNVGKKKTLETTSLN
ncbi:hypothetical protein MPER_15624, partial [Moniliophthora perniciosa FA553]